MTNNLLLTIVFQLALMWNVTAQPSTQAMSINDAIKYAVNENTDIKKQNLALIKSKYLIAETTSSALPSINGSAQFTDNLKIQEQLLPGEIFGQPGTFLPVKFGVQYAIPLTVKLEQVIYSKALHTAIQQTKLASQISEIQKQQITEEVIYSVATSYHQTVLVREQQYIIDANLAQLKQSVNVAQVQYDNQMIRKIDLDQLKVNLANTQTEKDNAFIVYQQSLDLLKVLMGYPLGNTLTLTDSIDDHSFSIPVNAVNNNPMLSMIDKQFELKQMEIKGIRSNYYPTLAGFAQYGYQTQFDEFTSDQMKWNSSAMIGASLNIPIFDGFQKKRQVQQRQLEKNSIELDKVFMTDQLTVQYNIAVRNYSQSNQTAINQEANYELAQSVLEAVLTNYKNGLASLSDVINADSGLKGAQTQYLTALLQKRIAALDIYKANGSMTSLIEN